MTWLTWSGRHLLHIADGLQVQQRDGFKLRDALAVPVRRGAGCIECVSGRHLEWIAAGPESSGKVAAR